MMKLDERQEAENKIEDAHSILRREYWEHVRGIAEEIKEEILDGYLENYDSYVEYIDESIDSSEWVIYTARAMQVLYYSDNDDSGINELGADGFDWSNGVPWSQLAYFALRQDVIEQLDAHSIDWSTMEAIEDSNCLHISDVIEYLESASIECRDDESEEVLRKALRVNILDGTIEL